ncbi:MAG: dimethyl sulfoxide reductase anchor subunit [Proteobacteria bacterium]|nr:dimethyl sulfoxide reductase anchor subunit [Pseudomonadota bacterium]
MFEVREDEPMYALLKAVETDQKNIYGSEINLTQKSGQPEGVSLRINGDEGVGNNPDRYKQHGFHFTADNCIGCHACEAACSEKNDLPPHLSFRSVGYVEGGTYPNFTRMNISMACNHCDDPVCLKGCPTRAYTKHPEYGAVLQDPDICFGCGYCTWVCPYNAPQLDPVEGHVQKCNMCVDRLEVGLKPACVAACVGNALDFGVIETTPENREQKKTSIPGFPDPKITNPNIRFQQTKSMPREFTRTDSEPVKYHKKDSNGEYKPVVDKKKIKDRQWNLAKLSSRENPLVIFTLTTQAAIGAFLITFLGSFFGVESLQTLTESNVYVPFLFSLIGMQAFVLFLSTQHLGKPMRFYRGFNNLRHSPLSREALGVAMFLNGLIAVAVLSSLDHGFFNLIEAGTIFNIVSGFVPWLDSSMSESSPGSSILGITTKTFAFPTVAAGLIGLYYMYSIYRIKARPFWDHWQVMTSFFGTMFSLGGVIIGLVCIPLSLISGISLAGLLNSLAGVIAFGLLLEAIGHIFHARDLNKNGGEGSASYHLLTSQYGNTYITRNIVLGISIVAVYALGSIQLPEAWQGLMLWSFLAGIILVTSLVSRALFYVMVIPTTMPGAFFWKNKGFEEHARETGLAKLPQVGVLPCSH